MCVRVCARRYAGLQASISWNVVYNPYEGIVAPVFRGNPWAASKPHAYVLFEWDTYLASMLATVTDEWVAASNIIRMTKALTFKGYVPGYWNGLCGEVDKSKPPVAALALEFFLAHHTESTWVASLLLDQLVMWSRWWSGARRYSASTGGRDAASGLIAPGSNRENELLPLSCNGGVETPVSNRVSTITGETGLDNSPLYDRASFVLADDVIDTLDVGLSALYARDCQSLAAIARGLGRAAYAAELAGVGASMVAGINAALWNEAESTYLNRLWTNGTWSPVDPETHVFVVAPTTFYPMLAGAPSDAQVARMVSRYLANSSEFGVNERGRFGMPSVSRSSSAAGDNNYWRGRQWGPMNALVYLGLANYAHLPAAKQAMADLAAQSEATFLGEWVANHRVMENYNSNTGQGCDSGDAVPFYHWGALNALVPLLHSGLVRA